MHRKWTFLAVALSLTVGLAAVMSSNRSIVADELEDASLQEIMEKVNKTNLSITKAVRTAVAYKKAGDGQDVIKDAEDLVKLGKRAREFTEPSEKQNLPYEKWTELMDEFIQASEDMAGEIRNGAGQMEARQAHNVVKKACTNCHNEFRVDEDDF